MLLGVLLACKSDEPFTDDPFDGEATLSVDQGAAGALDESFGLVGVSEADGDGYRVWATGDPDAEYTLLAVMQEQTLLQVHLRHGNQMIAGDAASCTATLGTTADPDQPESLDLSCADFSDGQGGNFSFEAHLEGGSSQSAARAEWVSAEAWSAWPRAAEGDALDPAWALMVPWRGDERWVLADSGGHGTRADVELRLTYQVDGVALRRFAAPAATGALALTIVADEEVSAGVEGVEGSVSGTDFELPLWEDLQAGEDELFVKIQ